MPPRTRRLRFASHAVTTVVISHDGARWLDDCLGCLAAQTRPPQRVVAVDTASSDDSPQLLKAALGESAVVFASRTAGLATAVRLGLDAFAGAPASPRADAVEHEWVWILHDDCAPDPDALERLLERVDEAPSIAVVGPKVLTWDRHNLLEVGVTVDSSGIRRTGLEPREVDQGQHDDVDDVLAVGTAGLLVRRDVWDRVGGLDPGWELFGDDVDFGWRVNAAGGRVAVAPRAVVRHAAALTNGRRSADAVAGSAGGAARAHGMQIVLTNTSPWLVAPLLLRYVVEVVARAVLALVPGRSPRRAMNEVVALALLVSHPHVVITRRRARSSQRVRTHRELRHLLAPPSWRWRHAADALAATFVGTEAVEERQRRRAPVETGPVAAESESFAVDDLGVLARFLTRPGVLLVLMLTALALVADRHLYGGTLHGGRLLPASAGASDLWSTYTSGWHPVGFGSTTQAPPWIAVFAVLATVCLGKVWLAVDILVLGAVPLAGLSAYAATSGLTRRWPVRVWAAAAYALAPIITGAVAGGRLDVIVVVVLVPVVTRACIAVLRPGGRHGLNRAVGAGLLLALCAAFAPIVWVVAVLAIAAGLLLMRGPQLLGRALAGLAVVAVAPVVLVPWTAQVVMHPSLAVRGIGLPDLFAARHGPSGLELLLAHPGGPAQPPLWTWGPVIVAAVVGVASQRRLARAGFVLFASALAVALVVSRLSAPSVADGRYWTGATLAVAAAGALLSAAVAIDEAPGALRRHAFGWRQPLAAVVGIAGVAALLAISVGWAVRGSGQPLTATSASVLPVFAQAEAAAPTTPRTLVVRGSDDVVRYVLLRGETGLRLGDADVAPAASAAPASRHALSAAVADAAAGRDQALGELAEFGVVQVVVPDASARTTAGLANVDGLARVPATSTVVYRSSLSTGELVLLGSRDASTATAGQPLPSTAKPVALTAGAGTARVTVPGSTDTNRLLVLAEPHSGAWRATIDGHRLPSATAYGWAQAWRLPAAGGRLTVQRSDAGRTAALVVELVAVLIAVVLCLPTRRDDR